LALILGVIFVVHDVPWENPDWRLASGARQGDPVWALANLAFLLFILQFLACLVLMILNTLAVLRWQTAALRCWQLGKFFMGTLIGTGLGLGVPLAWALRPAR
jgi:hypothetical protein